MIDVSRHSGVFSPHSFGDKRIDVVGIGATGSRIVLALAKLGIANIHIWDPDTVEEHNIANQVYGLSDIGRRKVDALQDIVRAQTGTELSCHAERVDGTQVLGPVVFLLTDTMESRKEIWEKSLKLRPGVEVVVETRMGSNTGRIYLVSPTSPADIKGWEETLYADDVAEVSACGATISVGPTAEVVSGLAVWQFIRWCKVQSAFEAGKEPEDEPENELVFSLQPMVIMTRNF